MRGENDSMVGGTLVGAYRVVHLIGEGGMGSVWLAEHAMLGRRAAIKVLLPELAARPDIVARFFNEAKAATEIADPGVVQVFDFGSHVDGSAYIVMELLDGEALSARLARLGVVPLREALTLMRQAASTLGAVHARGIVHRDLKPSNIMIVRDPEVAGGERPKILDFGIAKLADNDTGTKTNTAAMLGTPRYMSPEQCRGAGLVDQRADIYSLGCVLFELVCGRAPFEAEGGGELIAMHLMQPPPRASSLRPDLPADVDALIARCLEKEPAARFASGSELAIALGTLTGSSPQIAPTPVPWRTVASPTTLSYAAAISSAPAPTRTRSRVWVAAAVGVATTGAVIAAVTLPGSHDDAPAPASIAAPSTPAPPTPPSAAVSIRAALAAFVAWSHTHAGAPCPDVVALGEVPADPWGHTLRLTCTDQPADQMIGAISAGPDGAPGTADDIASWHLGSDVTDLVRGPSWLTAVAASPPPSPAPPQATATSSHNSQATATHAHHAQPAHATPAPAPAIQLDANGLPITRSVK